MRKLYVVLVGIFVLTVSCTEKGAFDITGSHESTQGNESAQTKANSFVSDSGPYDLRIAQHHFESFLRESHQPLEHLRPTHYAIKMYFDNWNEFKSIEKDSSLIVFDEPFGFDYGSIEHPLISSNKMIMCNDITEECVVYNEVSEENREISPLYVFWPADRSLPEAYEYEICYEAFITDSPQASFFANTSSAISEWMEAALSPERDSESRSGYVYSFDNTLSAYVPVRNARIIFSSGNRLNYVDIDSSGCFTLPSWLGNDEFLTLCLVTSDYVIRDGSGSSVYKINLGQISSLFANSDQINIYLPRQFELDIYQAAWYYFYGSNTLLDNIINYQTVFNEIDIHAINSSNGNIAGEFYNISTPYINIYNYSTSSSSISATVWHELGHATQRATNGQVAMANTALLITESYASFFGWFNALIYYSSILSVQSDVNSICHQGRQTWSGSGVYTPLFVDLYDDFNQHNNSSNYVDDKIEDVPVSVIVGAAMNNQTFSGLNSCLLNYCGVYYSASDYNDLIALY